MAHEPLPGMTISVAMATYNGGRYLREQLDSIRRQSLLPTELVVCDDGSSDDTVEILRAFAANAPFKVVIDAHGQKLGFTPNFLRAIAQCTGEIVALCDQDDQWDERKLAVCVLPFADQTVMTVTHRVRVVDENLTPTGMIRPPASLRGRYTLFNLDPWFSPNGMQFLFRRRPITPWLTGMPPLTLYAWWVTETFDEWIYHVGTLLGAVIILDDILGVWRRHGATVTDGVQALGQRESATDNLNCALHSGAGAYEFRVRLADSRGDFAARTVALPDGTSVTTTPAAVEYFRRMSRMYRDRVHLHDPTSGRLDRLRTFLRLAAHRAYRSRDRGGLGAKAVLKDGFTVFFGPRTPFGGTHKPQW